MRVRVSDVLQDCFRFLIVVVYLKRKEAHDEKVGELEGKMVESRRTSVQGVSKTYNSLI